MSLVTFSKGARLMVPPTTDGPAIHRALASVATQARARRFDSSAMWDAVFASASLVVEHRGRPVVVVLSDGADNASWLFTNQPEDATWIRTQKERTIDALRGSGIVIDVVWVPAFRTPGPFRDKYYGALSPDEPAESTGGVAFSAGDKNLGRRIAERLNGLRSGYVLTYTPSGVPQGDGWHTLKVRLKDRRGEGRSAPGVYLRLGEINLSLRDVVVSSTDNTACHAATLLYCHGVDPNRFG